MAFRQCLQCEKIEVYDSDKGWMNIMIAFGGRSWTAYTEYVYTCSDYCRSIIGNSNAETKAYIKNNPEKWKKYLRNKEG